MKLLALDTCTEACSTALWLDGQILERYELAPRRHIELMLVMLDALMAEAGIALRDLDGLAFGRGPGAFSGVRIGCSAVQALAVASDLPIAPISTLAALAYDAYLRLGIPTILAAIDARMQEVYWAAYEVDAQGALHERSEERVAAPALVNLSSSIHTTWVVTGSGGDLYREEFTAHLPGKNLHFDVGQYPRAGVIARLGERALRAGLGVSAADAQPTYLRNEVATPN